MGALENHSPSIWQWINVSHSALALGKGRDLGREPKERLGLCSRSSGGDREGSDFSNVPLNNNLVFGDS